MVMNFVIKGLLVVLCTLIYANHGGSVSSVMVNEECGAPQFVFSAESPNSTKNCQFAMLQGRREYQEDRVVCNLDLKLPLSGEGGLEEITVGIAAIFDGHGGNEASELASAMLINSFLMNVALAAYTPMLPSNEENNKSYCSPRRTPAIMDHYSLGLILEEALLKVIQDIDSEFSKVALDKGYISGTTGTILLLFSGQFLVANVGDSKALLCSKKVIPHHDTEGRNSLKEVYVEELTRDHHPDREDEKGRIQAAGGFITRYGVPRVNGILALSRAIGDIYLKRYGVTAEAEITGWRRFPTSENSYLVVASDGIFETLTPKNVCDLVYDKAVPSEHASLPEWIVRHAFRTGSTDNLSAIVISDFDSFNHVKCNRES